MEEVMLYDFISLMNDFVNQTWFFGLTIAVSVFIVISAWVPSPKNIFFEEKLWFSILVLSLVPILFSLFNCIWIPYVIFLSAFLISFMFWVLTKREILIKKQKSDISKDETDEIIFKYTSKQLKHPKDFPELFKVLC
jgi:uncharacterized membrane protein YhdT